VTISNPLEPHRATLLLEAALSSDAIGYGLTALRSYSFADKGRFFSGMFMLSIGLERILKLILVFDEGYRSGALPTDDALRTAGHDITSLLAHAKTINASRGLGVQIERVEDPLCRDLVALVSAFARRARYHNLNVLSGAARDEDEEPLAAWDRVIGAELVRRHHRRSKDADETLELARAVDRHGGAVVLHSAEDGAPIRTMETLAEAEAHIGTKQKYATWYALCVVEFCADLLKALDEQVQPPTYVSEHFRYFHTLDRQSALRRKRWDRR